MVKKRRGRPPKVKTKTPEQDRQSVLVKHSADVETLTAAMRGAMDKCEPAAESVAFALANIACQLAARTPLTLGNVFDTIVNVSQQRLVNATTQALADATASPVPMQ